MPPIYEKPTPVAIVDLPKRKLEGIQFVGQGDKLYWCWVACAAMVFQLRGVHYGGMCDIAGIVFNDGNCCGYYDVPLGPCDEPLDDAGITALYAYKGITTDLKGGNIEDKIEDQIDQGSPAQIGYTFVGFGRDAYGDAFGHVVLVYGYQEDGRGPNGTSYFIHDPLRGPAQSAGDIDEGIWDATWLFPV